MDTSEEKWGRSSQHIEDMRRDGALCVSGEEQGSVDGRGLLIRYQQGSL